MADPTITALMHANLYEVFGQRDHVLRRDAIARTYTDDVAFTDHAGTIVGLAAVDDRVQQLLRDAPAAFAFAAKGPVYFGEDTAAMAWRLGPPDSEPVALVSTSRPSKMAASPRFVRCSHSCSRRVGGVGSDDFRFAMAKQSSQNPWPVLSKRRPKQAPRRMPDSAPTPC